MNYLKIAIVTFFTFLTAVAISGSIGGGNSIGGQTSIVKSGSYTATPFGFSGTCSDVTVQWVKVGDIVNLQIPSRVCTSNSASFYFTGTNAPAEIKPPITAGSKTCVLSGITDNGVATWGNGAAHIQQDGSIDISRNGIGWTNTGLKGITQRVMCTYFVSNP